MKHYDIIIIGSGGGTKLRPAADKGKTVAIIEKEELWGTCLNKWCIPSKMLIYPSDIVTHLREDTKHLHISWVSKASIDFSQLVEDTTQEVGNDSFSIEWKYNNHPNITLYRGHARFVENKVLEINGEKISAEKIYIATGSRPQIPAIEWLAETPYMTSKEALRTTKLPKSMIIIWGGYIAVELGHVYGAAGCEVHFLVRSGMIKAEDKDIREVFEADFSHRYNVHFWVSPTQVRYTDGTFFVTVKDTEWKESIMQSEALFVATWVLPNSDELGLEHTDITLDKKWYIEVNEFLETKVSWVYALGDVVWNYLFRHSVNFEGEYLLREYFSEKNTSPKPIHYPPMPHAIFTYPQIAWVWVTEDELQRDGKVMWKDYEIAIHHYKNSAMGMAMKPKVWLVKLIALKSNWEIIGAHILWEKASDLIHMMIVLISARKTVDFMLDEMIFIHPALAEVIRNTARTLKEKL